MKSIGLILLLLVVSCGKELKKSPQAQSPDGVTCGKDTMSLVGSAACLPAAIWYLRMDREGFTERFSFRINQSELFNTCDGEEIIISTRHDSEHVYVQFGYLALPTKENISLEVFHCDDGRRLAHADPAVFEVSRNESSNVYTVRANLQRD